MSRRPTRLRPTRSTSPTPTRSRRPGNWAKRDALEFLKTTQLTQRGGKITWDVLHWLPEDRAASARPSRRRSRTPATRSPPPMRGNDEAAKAFTDETGIKTYKWSVADYDACKDGIAQVEAELGPIEVLVNNAGITRDAHVPQDDAGAVARGDRHQPQRPLQHDPPGLARHARAQVRADHQHQLDQRPEGPGRSGQLFRRQGGRHRLDQGAGAGRRARRHHRQRDLPRLHRHRDGPRRSTRRC